MLKELLIKHKRTIITYSILILSLVLNIVSIRSCSESEQKHENNLVAMSDTIKFYKTKNGELVATKTLLEGDLNTLKIINDSLYDVVKQLDVEQPEKIVYIENVIDRPSIDTLWLTDTIIAPYRVQRNFSFTDEYRTLEGNVFAENNSLGLNILKDKVYFDYVLTFENNTLHIVSNNPYIQYNKITGINLKDLPKPVLSATAYANLEYSFNNKIIEPKLGIETTFKTHYKGFFEYNLSNNDKIIGVGYKYTFNIK